MSCKQDYRNQNGNKKCIRLEVEAMIPLMRYGIQTCHKGTLETKK